MTLVRRSAATTLGLGVLSLLGLALAHLALTDVAHGEGDLTAEWRMVQLAGGLCLLVHLSALSTAVLVLRERGGRSGAKAAGAVGSA